MRYRRKLVPLMSGTLMLITVYLCGWNQPLDEAFMELSSCPACYGQDLCPAILPQHNGGDPEIELKGLSGWKIMKFINYKNVYYGCRGENILVLKKLAHTTELREFDKNICSMKKELYCNVSNIIDKLLQKNSYDIASVVRQHPSVFGKSDIIMCNHSRVIQHLYREYTKIDGEPHQHQHFLTMLAINSEPLLINVSTKVCESLKFCTHNLLLYPVFI